MDLGTGIPLSVGIASLAIAAYKVIPSRRRQNGNGIATGAKCPLHPAIEAGMDRMCKETAATRKMTLAIAKHLKVPLDAIAEELKEMLE